MIERDSAEGEIASALQERREPGYLFIEVHALRVFRFDENADAIFEGQHEMPRRKAAICLRERVSCMAYTGTAPRPRCPRKSAISANDKPLLSSRMAQACRRR